MLRAQLLRLGFACIPKPPLIWQFCLLPVGFLRPAMELRDARNKAQVFKLWSDSGILHARMQDVTSSIANVNLNRHRSANMHTANMPIARDS